MGFIVHIKNIIMYQRMRKGVGLVGQRNMSLCFVFAYHTPSAHGLLCVLQVFQYVEWFIVVYQ